jgi:hypothetical protein
VVLEGMLEGSSSKVVEDEVVVFNTPQVITDKTPSTIIPLRSGRIVR